MASFVAVAIVSVVADFVLMVLTVRLERKTIVLRKSPRAKKTAEVIKTR